MSLFVIIMGVIMYVFGYVMGIICASKGKKKDSPANYIEINETFEEKWKGKS